MTATLTYTLGRFVWRELFTRDVAAAKRFYSGMFGWTSEDRPMDGWTYTLFNHNGQPLAGLMDIAAIPDGGQVPPHWAVYVSVEDVDAAAAKAVALGGRALGDCHEIPGVGRFAILQDPQGAHFNLFRSADGDPEDGMPGIHEFCWESLNTTDVAAALPFYQQVVGWGTDDMAGMALFTRKAANGETVSLASTGQVQDGQPPHWATFVAVENLEAAASKCRELGGQVFIERIDIPDVGAFGVIQDPAEAVIYLFEEKCQ